MFGFRIKALTFGLAALAFAGTASLPTAPAEAQGYYGRPGRVVVGARPGFRPAYAPGLRRAYYPGYRGVYRPAYRPVARGYYPRRYGYYGPRYRYRSAGFYGRPYGYYGPRYRYGYYGYPSYRRHSNGGAVAAGLIGGLALGAIAANAARPVYRERPVYSRCWFERRRMVNHSGRALIRRVRVCY